MLSAKLAKFISEYVKTVAHYSPEAVGSAAVVEVRRALLAMARSHVPELVIEIEGADQEALSQRWSESIPCQ